MSPPAVAPLIRYCEHCNGPITYRRRYWQRYSQVRFCSKKCCGSFHSGERHGSWKGGIITDEGYRKVSINAFPEAFRHLIRPMLRKHRMDLLEHRAVVAIVIGRPLTASETVHHRNGDKQDNRPENLELRVGPHGVGATASALVCPHCHRAYDDSSR